MASLKQNHVFRNIILVLLPIVTAIVCMGIGRMSMSPGEIVTNLFEIAVHGPESVDPDKGEVVVPYPETYVDVSFSDNAGNARTLRLSPSK